MISKKAANIFNDIKGDFLCDYSRLVWDYSIHCKPLSGYISVAIS